MPVNDDHAALLTERDVSRETLRRLDIYAALLRQWQARINLVSPATLPDLWARHILDSVQAFNVRSDFRTWLDIGSGAGFPGLVVAILKADQDADKSTSSVALLESVGKKCAFMRTVVRETGLASTNVTVQVINDRIERRIGDFAGVDVVSARALASLNDLLTMAEQPLMAGATGLFFKGERHAEEIEQAHNRWDFTCTAHGSPLQAGSTLLEIVNLKRR